MLKPMKIMKTSSVALMLTGAAMFTLTPVAGDVAYAKSDRANGNGKPAHAGPKPAHVRSKPSQARPKPTQARPKTEHVRPTKPERVRTTTSRSTTIEPETDLVDDIEDTISDEETTTTTARNHGAVASELGWRNAAHASPNALANASPNSRPGQLAAYRDAVLENSDLEGNVVTAEDELTRLTGLTDDEIADEFPDGGYGDALVDATDDLAVADTALDEAPEAGELLDMIDGSDLSDEAITELHRLLDIQPTPDT